MKFSFLIFSNLIVLQIFSGCLIAQNRRSETVHENFLAGTTWKVDGVPFETKSREKYLLSKYDNLEFGNWGHTISFEKSTFNSSYSAPCGNDCFTSVMGEYRFTDKNTISVKVKQIDRHGFCEKRSEILNQDMGTFLLSKKENGWELIKENRFRNQILFLVPKVKL